jgi:phenylacetyl-CoA:acceptor oxidoreductase subunit 1
MVRYGMVLDTFKCVRCHACTTACKAENSTPAGVYWHTVLDKEYGKYPNTTRRYIPRPCMHCDNPPCVTACPTGASFKREDGIVLIDYDKCIGCRYCISACPYGVRTYMDNIEGYFPEVGLTPVEQGYQNHRLNVVEKCTLCVHRIDEGVKKGLTPGVDRDATPACMYTCPAKARIFGDLDDPNSEVSKAAIKAQPLLSSLGTLPKVTYVGPLIPEPDLIAEFKKAQILPPDSLKIFKDVLKPVGAAAIGVVALAALINMAKSRGEESGAEKEEPKESKKEVK